MHTPVISAFALQVQGAEQPAGTGDVQTDFFQLLGEGGAIAQVVLVILIIFSLISWAVIFYKFWQFSRVERQTRTFLDVFPHATLWFDGNLMVGALEPLRLDPATIEAKRSSPVLRAALDDVGLTSFEVLASWYTASPATMRNFVGPGPVLTDDQPLVEYHRSLPRDAQPLDLTSLRSDVREIVP